jgi:glucosamine-6-phosphate deaminase
MSGGIERILENVPVEIFSDEGDGLAERVARQIVEEVQKNNAAEKATVLGLPSGNTALDVYRELIRLHQTEKTDFSRVIAFGLSEYFEVPHDHVFSVRCFLHENLFHFINIRPENIHLLDGFIPEKDLPEHFARFDAAIVQAGGIDIQLLDIDDEGNVGFNNGLTQSIGRVKLTEGMRIGLIPDFGDMEHTPKEALTIGVMVIKKARRIFMLATGDHKASVIRRFVERGPEQPVALSFLAKHPNLTLCLDEAAASLLTRNVTPWFFGSMHVDWSNEISRVRAVCHLSEFLHKTIPSLETRDFLQYSLQDLVMKYPIDTLRQEVMKTIGSKIVNNDKLPKDKKVIIFSPHPDDDIISMGATLLKLVQNKNEVHCVYMTPGSNAVFDHDVEKVLLGRVFYAQQTHDAPALAKEEALLLKVQDFMRQKKASRFGMMDIPEVRMIKQIIRQTEGSSTCLYAKVAGWDFLDPPFYHTGKAKKNPLTEADVDIIWNVIQKHKPHIIYAAGDLTDPNGTHRLCLRGIIKAMGRYKPDDPNKPELWLYRGAWQEYHPAEGDMYVSMSKEDMPAKREGIFRHQSQKDRPPQPGHSNKEFWQRAEERNLSTAKLFASYGITGIYALEGFKRYKQ